MTLLIYFINLLFDILSLAIIARALLSWFRINPYHPAVTLLNQITEPILAPLRRYIPPIGMIDITPIVALILLQLIRRLLITLLMGSF
ncbi:MAG: YggT family protein [Anaerolineae bacterium]